MKEIAAQVFLYVWLGVILVVAGTSDGLSQPVHVVMVSIDGMRADAVEKTVSRGIALPVLSGLIANGTSARGVIPANPSVTYPNHTTLITGVWPASHGIYANGPFDPMGTNKGGWYWYSEDVKSKTLWEAASQAGLVTASVSWPVTVGAAGITYNIPEFGTESTDRVKAIRAVSRPDTLLAGLEQSVGPYGADSSEDSDQMRLRYAKALYERYKPSLMTVHLVSVDHASHEHGPWSAETLHALLTADRLVGELRATVLETDPAAVTVVVSDHGFAQVDWLLNLRRLFADHGFIQTSPIRAGEKPDVVSWRAAVWNSGGAAAIVLKDPKDPGLLAAVRGYLEELRRTPKYGIEKVYGPDEVERLSAWPNASFVVEMKSGYAVGGDFGEEVLISEPSSGQHGYLSSNPDMLASFMIEGSSIARGRHLGLIDMRRIAPTVGAVLGVKLSPDTLSRLAVLPGDSR